MTTLGNTHDRIPDWQVTAVFDPDGEGHDFAYTVGLFERELPELHLWARPSLGDDPGADWKFSPHDCCRILNELAWQLIDRELEIGDTWEHEYDGGLVTARFRLDPPGDRDELEAFGIAPGALVLPVRWSLHRRPIGRPRPLGKRGLQRATSEYAELLAGRVAEFWSADAITLNNLHWAAAVMDEGGGITWPLARANAVARDLGRVEQTHKTQDLARGLVESRLQDKDLEDELVTATGFRPQDGTPAQIHRALLDRFTELLWTVLSTEVVADRLTSAHRLHARGAWLTGLGPVGELPGPQWRAPRRVLDGLYTGLRPLGTTAILELVGRHCDEDLEDYQRLAGAALGWALVAPAGCPWRGGLERLPGVFRPRPIVPLQQWATVMTSAACHRERLSADDVATLTTPFLDLVPELPSVISAGGR